MDVRLDWQIEAGFSVWSQFSDVSWIYCSQNYKLFDLERTWWRIFQKRVVQPQFDIYVIIKIVISSQ